MGEGTGEGVELPEPSVSWPPSPSPSPPFVGRGDLRGPGCKGISVTLHYGVHGGIKAFYKMEPEEEHPATLDHVVSAVAG